MSERCPTCKRPLVEAKTNRFCCLCNKQIGRHDKWFFNADGRIEHRHCKHPESYCPELDGSLR